MISSWTILHYNIDKNGDKAINNLKDIFKIACTEKEKLTRSLLIGCIFFDEKRIDSAIIYLKPVFENEQDKNAQIQAANYLRIIYNSTGDTVQADEYARFIAKHQISTGENKYLVSQLSHVFNDYQNIKRENNIIKERKVAIYKTLVFFVIIIFIVVVTIVLIARCKRRKQINAEREVYLQNQASMSGRLKRSNQDIKYLKKLIKVQNQEDKIIPNTAKVTTFTEEPIRKLIMERVNEGQFKSHVDCLIYKRYALTTTQIVDLLDAINRHYNNFTTNLRKQYPTLTNSDINYCCMYMLGLTEADIAALMQKAYNTVCYRGHKLKGIFGTNESLSVFIKTFANKLNNNMLAQI